MLPSFYQTCLQSQLTQTQFVTLEILVELLQKERRITIERLATLFPQPILFESRRRNIQRFLSLPQLTPQAIWFPIVKQWIKRHHPRSKPLHLVIDRTQWQDHNLIMAVSCTRSERFHCTGCGCTSKGRVRWLNNEKCCVRSSIC